MFQLGFFVSVSLAGVATATIVTIGTGPVVAGLLDRVRRGTPLRRRWWTGVGVAVLGIALTTGAGTVTLNPAGMASAVIAGCCFPVFGSAIRDLTADRPALTAVATVFGAAILPAAILLAIAGSKPAATPGTVIALLYLGVVTTAIAYALWSAGLARLTLADTVTLTMLEPVAATVMAIAILCEPAGPTTILGITATLSGVWIASTIRNRQSAPSVSSRGGSRGHAARDPLGQGGRRRQRDTPDPRDGCAPDTTFSLPEGSQNGGRSFPRGIEFTNPPPM